MVNDMAAAGDGSTPAEIASTSYVGFRVPIMDAERWRGKAFRAGLSLSDYLRLAAQRGEPAVDRMLGEMDSESRPSAPDGL